MVSIMRNKKLPIPIGFKKVKDHKFLWIILFKNPQNYLYLRHIEKYFNYYIYLHRVMKEFNLSFNEAYYNFPVDMR